MEWFFAFMLVALFAWAMAGIMGFLFVCFVVLVLFTVIPWWVLVFGGVGWLVIDYYRGE